VKYKLKGSIEKKDVILQFNVKEVVLKIHVKCESNKINSRKEEEKKRYQIK